jgi:hypothetical protein
MKFRNSIFVAAVTAAAAVSIPASAATIATAMTPLNIRSGPGRNIASLAPSRIVARRRLLAASRAVCGVR